MELSREICLEVQGHSLPVQIRRESRVRSLHTGRDLYELHGWVTTPDAEQHRWLAAVLPELGERAVRASNRAGEFAGKWRISWNAYSEVHGIHTYTLILREAEELTLEALLVEGLELHPYEYREEVVPEGLMIWAKVVGTEAEVQRLRALMHDQGELSVIRQGIEDQPRQMRVGTAEWSPFDNRVKFRLVLVEREVEERRSPGFARLEAENSQLAFGFYANYIERLAQLLVDRGVLSREELEAAREAARMEPGLARPEFWRVTDVDAL